MTNEVKTHELTTWSGRTYLLTQHESNRVRERMEAGAKFLVVPNGTSEGNTISLNDIKGLSKRQLSVSDMVDGQKGLPEGEKPEFDPFGPGYIRFLAMSIKLALSGNKNIQTVLAKINDEQRPLVNAELKRMEVNYSV